MDNYVALLRGINVGGRQLKMEQLRTMLSKLGYQNVKTLLASGNVVFSAEKTQPEILRQTIQTHILETFDMKVAVLIRSSAEIKALIHKDPFAGIPVTPETRLYVTFLSNKPEKTLKIPFESEDGAFKVVMVTPGEICCAIVLSPQKGTLDLMSFVEKEYGKLVTTRNWNTVKKIAALL
jgi:uncharacterized protein (DUF1697 family)